MRELVPLVREKEKCEIRKKFETIPIVRDTTRHVERSRTLTRVINRNEICPEWKR